MKPQSVSFLSQKKIKEYHHFTTVSRETGHKKKKKVRFLLKKFSRKKHFQNHSTTVTFFFLENVLFPDGVGWVGWDGVSKVSFNFLYTLWVYRSCICILIYIVKSCPHKFLVGLKFWSCWGSRCKNSKTPTR